jgi:hypothetical protein
VQSSDAWPKEENEKKKMGSNLIYRKKPIFYVYKIWNKLLICGKKKIVLLEYFLCDRPHTG